MPEMLPLPPRGKRQRKDSVHGPGRALKAARMSSPVPLPSATQADKERLHQLGYYSLHQAQRQAFSYAVNKRQSIALLGPAGSGKSYLLRTICKALQTVSGGQEEDVAITALTGSAAANLG
ncbi:hypothetical protein K466DRAFT_607755, partial [Polyporus arcularius HHB13444]